MTSASGSFLAPRGLELQEGSPGRCRPETFGGDVAITMQDAEMDKLSRLLQTAHKSKIK